MNKQELKQMALQAIEDAREELIAAGQSLYATPETGFKEYKTAALVKYELEKCGLVVRNQIALTGVKAKAKGRSSKANIALMGELDALIMPGHPKSDPQTGAFHGCGHHAQLTTLLGVAVGLVRTGLMKELDGDVTFIGVPAEEIVEIEERRAMIREGKIGFTSGKQELIRLGELDDVDMILCSHIMDNSETVNSWVGHSWNGLVNKSICFRGKSAHAGLAPEKGVNALEAALCAMNNINAMRENFKDEDHVRIHYIITKGGDSPNIVPDHVTLEMGIRAATVESLLEVNRRVDSALKAGADVIGASVEIHDAGMYLPCHQNRALGDLYLANAREFQGPAKANDVFGQHRGSSTDCGDVASLLPLLHPYFGGAAGVPHAQNFDIVDPYAAYVAPAKLAAATIIDLLFDGAEEAVRIKKDFVPAFSSREEYLRESMKHMDYSGGRRDEPL